MTQNITPFSEFKLSSFLKELGSASSSPGGGTAAGLCGALGTALIEMVARINEQRISKKNAGAQDPEANQRIHFLNRARLQFEELMTLDCQAFLEITKLYKEKAEATHYQAALKKGASAPFAIAELAAKTLDLGIAELPRTSPWLISDLTEASILLPAAFYSARLSVEINLKSIDDATFVKDMRQKLLSLENMMAMSKEKYKTP